MKEQLIFWFFTKGKNAQDKTRSLGKKKKVKNQSQKKEGLDAVLERSLEQDLVTWAIGLQHL